MTHWVKLFVTAVFLLSSLSVFSQSDQSQYNNEALIDLEDAIYNTAIIDQFHDGGSIEPNQAEIKQSGFANLAVIKQSGNHNLSSIKQDGNLNIAVSKQVGSNKTANISQVGNRNKAFVGQYGVDESNISLEQNNNRNLALIATSAANSGTQSYTQNGGEFLFIHSHTNRSIKIIQGR
ncbi:hypothetical protein [Vibrio maerlii]|uniref:hypothetical protein n=1 Tax=Vibrio maerlii TaxID=2231648 RepID=UPI000E3B5EDF|nr:hypothetical protein [Vibrio maerlii]